MSMEKDREVYAYVKENAFDYLPTILQAITDGVRNENLELRQQKSKVECGLVVLADAVNLDKLKTNMRSTLIDALKNCTFVKMESFLEKL